jgi:hypothetical protein
VYKSSGYEASYAKVIIIIDNSNLYMYFLYREGSGFHRKKYRNGLRGYPHIYPGTELAMEPVHAWRAGVWRRPLLIC